MVTDPVISALLTALKASPHQDLQLAIAQRYMELDCPDEAVGHYAQFLQMDPANITALEGAVEAAQKAGLSQRAAGWQAIVEALKGVVLAPREEGEGSAQVEPQEQPLGKIPALRASSDEDYGEEPPMLHLLDASTYKNPDRITFADVGGLEAVKKRIEMAFLAPLREPELFRVYGKNIRGGMLLYGPPGCGKTYLARATAGEVGARFTSIGLIDVLDMWIGESEKKLHDIFEHARRNAPSVIFLDELDALGQKRSQLRNSAGRNLVNQLLVELDGIDSNDGVYVLAASNHPWDVDPALKRPGRFDRVIWVPPPDQRAREVILQNNMRHRPSKNLDFVHLAQQSKEFSGADLVHWVDSAVEQALEEALQRGVRRPVQMNDFVKTLGEVRPSIGSWIDLAKNYAMYANEGGMYDALATWLHQR